MNLDLTATEGDVLRKTTVKVGRPGRYYDGEGTVENLGTLVEHEVGVRVHENEVVAVFDVEADVRIGDLVQMPDIT